MLSIILEDIRSILKSTGKTAYDTWIQRSFNVYQNESRPGETMDFQTRLDTTIDNDLVTKIKQYFDIHRFLTEEGKTNPERNMVGEIRAVIDALDGTSNFAAGRPDFGISVALENNGDVFGGGIITPARGELLFGIGPEIFFAQPVYSHKRPASVDLFALPRSKGEKSWLQTSRVYIHTGRRRNFELKPSCAWNTIYAKLANPACYFSCSVALLEVALGKLDGAAIGFQNYWDFAAGRYAITMAGGVCEAFSLDWQILSASDYASACAIDKNGNEWLAHVIAARNEELFDELLAHFRS